MISDKELQRYKEYLISKCHYKEGSKSLSSRISEIKRLSIAYDLDAEYANDKCSNIIFDLDHLYNSDFIPRSDGETFSDKLSKIKHLHSNQI